MRYAQGVVVFGVFGFGFLLPVLFLFLALQLGALVRRHHLHAADRSAAAAWGTRERVHPQGRRLENRVFRLAYRLGGRLTVSDLVVDLDLSLDEARRFLDQLVDHTHVTMEVRDDGLVYYEFPEIIARRRGAEGDDDLPTRA